MPSPRQRIAASAPTEPTIAGGVTGSFPAVEDGAATAEGRARNTIIFSIATGLSRIAGLVREMVASALYGASGAASAFTLAFTVPNLLRSLFADMALSAAFVPVFTDLIEQKKRREALLLISTLFWVLLGGLTILCAVAMLTAPLYMPLFVGSEVSNDLGGAADGLVSGLSQVMLPTVMLLGLNGLLVGALNAYGHFTVPALSPLVWNGVIIVVNLALLPAFGGTGDVDGIYAQAIGVLVGTVVQLLMAVPVLRRYGIRLVPRVDLHDPRLRQVLVLMVPVALSLGLINFSALINSILASHVDDDGPRAIEAAFRLYMLPQGIFSVAIVTVLFPALSRAVSRRDRQELRGLVSSGMAQIVVLLVPVGLLFMSPVISHDIVETLFQRGKWTEANTDATTTALVWFGASLALNGVSLLLSRTFFALQRPWANTGLALGSLVAAAIASLAMYRPLGIAGIVLGTFVGNVVLVAMQIRLLRRETGGPLGLAPVARSLIQVLVASVVAVAVATGVVLIGRIAADAVDPGTGRSVVTIVYLGLAVIAGGVAYVGMARELRLRELEVAGGRFVRLGARLAAIGGRLPLVGTIGAVARGPLGRAVGALLGVLALPLVAASAIARWIAGRLVVLVPVTAAAGTGTLPVVAPTAERAPTRAPRASAPAAPAAPEPTDAVPPRGRRRPPVAPTAPAEEHPGGLYDAAVDWPTIGQRGGETLDVPWPGVEPQPPADLRRPPPAEWAEPSWGGPSYDQPEGSLLDVYGVDQGPEEVVSPERRAEREARREEARRMMAAREAALERMAERQRAREGGSRGPRRGRRRH
ncbi:murein biosynthesis integral membrane protein MurJ [Patulibacter defluvii]|uniref:murein biosynthesis integral membrane protein MurJ n=1 Tax=Patulibacter defluvii TaxID=3095358 RepID=UPI002A75E4C2|nr:murein biosynthesis integral membrane protein MurJ [Patulibacter sp. DM4]